MPHSLDAEQSVLGAILFDNATLERLPALTPDSFFDPVHGRIFATCAQRIQKGILADAVTLRDLFTRDGTLTDLGGANYLLILLENAARLTSHAIQYAEVVRDMASRRAIIKAAQSAIEAALSPGERNIADIVQEAERGVQGALAGGGTDEHVSLQDAAQRVVENLRHPLPPGVGSGLAALDRSLGGFYAPDLIVLAARPAMGKTSLAVNLAVNVARANKVDETGQHIRDRIVGFFSMEMSAEQLAGRALARSSSARGDLAFAYSDLRSRRRPNADTVERFAQTMPVSLRINERGAHTLASLRAACRDIRAQHKALDLIVVDYLQLMADTAGRRDGRVQEISAITAGLKALAKDMNCPVIALSQLSRAVELRQDKHPQLSDLRESGSIEQDADIVLMVYREHYYLLQQEPQPREGETHAELQDRTFDWERRVAQAANKMEVLVAKNRHGPVGAIDLWCDLARDNVADFSPTESQPATHRQYWREQD